MPRPVLRSGNNFTPSPSPPIEESDSELLAAANLSATRCSKPAARDDVKGRRDATEALCSTFESHVGAPTGTTWHVGHHGHHVARGAPRGAEPLGSLGSAPAVVCLKQRGGGGARVLPDPAASGAQQGRPRPATPGDRPKPAARQIDSNRITQRAAHLHTHHETPLVLREEGGDSRLRPPPDAFSSEAGSSIGADNSGALQRPDSSPAVSRTESSSGSNATLDDSHRTSRHLQHEVAMPPHVAQRRTEPNAFAAANPSCK
ncbi:unnamed protein product [Lampetra planeri]